MFKSIKQSIDLVTVRIFSLVDLRSLIIAILLISITSSAVLSFFLGIKPEEFFLGEEEDVLVITPSGTSTPMTGKVPLSLIYDVRKLNGVETVSAEVITVVVIQDVNEKSIIVRGITSDFLDISQEIVLKGKWFDQLLNNSGSLCMKSGAVIGESIAENYGLKIGSKLTLVATLTPMTLEIQIEGIIKTGTPIDKELLLPLATVQALRNIGTDFVSFIKVKVNPSIITKSQLREIMIGEYEVPIKVYSHDNALVDFFNDFTILVYSSTGEFIESQSLGSTGDITFFLPFGTYRFIAESDLTQQSSSSEIFIHQSLSSPITIWIGKPRQDLVINVSYNDYPAINASVTAQEKYHPTEIYTKFTPSTGVIIFNDLPIGYYLVTVIFRGLSETLEVMLNDTGGINNSTLRLKIKDSSGISIRFENFLQMEVVNATNSEEINDCMIQFLNASNPIQIIYPNITTDNKTWFQYNSKQVLYIEEPGLYLVNFSVGDRTRSWIQTISGNTSSRIFIGRGNLAFTVLDVDGELAEGINVSIYLNEEIIDFKFTNSQGEVNFGLETGFSYKIVAKVIGNNTNITTTIFFEYPEEIILNFATPDPIEVHWLEINVYNGTVELPEFSGLSGCKIDLFNDSELIYSTLTNDEGNAQIQLNQSGNYFLNATYNEYNWYRNIIISEEITVLNIPLGDVKLKFIVRTSGNLPVADTNVEIYSNGTIISEITTNKTGESVINLPLGEYSIIITKFTYQEVISLTFIESQVYIIMEVIDLTGTLALKVVTSDGRAITGAIVIIHNSIYDILLTGITTERATIEFKDLFWGIYNVTVVIRNAIYDSTLVEFVEGFKFIVIELTMPSKINYDLIPVGLRERTNIEVIASEEFMNDFLGGALEIVTTTVMSFMFLVTALSLLNVSSVISYPILTNNRNLKSVKMLGGSFTQIYVLLSFQMVIIGLLASLFGSLLGILVMTQIEMFRMTNIGGLIIYPTSNPVIFPLIAIPNIFVILATIRQTLKNII